MTAAGVIAIGVPVRDEAERLPRMLVALARQERAPVFELCLFFDGCRDGSIELADALAGQLPYRVRTGIRDNGAPPNAGCARAHAMALALAAAADGVLMTTDADSEVAPGWIAANLAALEVADVAAGRIVRARTRGSAGQDRIEAYYDRLHALRRAIDPVAWEDELTHHCTSGASLALRAETYRALGGFAPLANGEDAALCDTAARHGHRVRRDARIVVRTSARRQGRAERGFAATLAAQDAHGHEPTVAHPEDEAWRFGMQAEARHLHGAPDHAGFAARLGLPAAEVAQVARECRNGEAFAARIVGAPPGGLRMVSLAHAEAVLAALAQTGLRGAA